MYEQMKQCWKAGYRMPKIMEVLNIKDEQYLLALFTEVIETELKTLKV